MGTFRDISGQVINGITVLRLSGRRGPSGQYYYTCRCHCGKEFEVMGGSLLSGHTKSCGCSRHEQRPNQYGPHGHFELVGKKVGELIVEKYNGYDSNIKQHLWECRPYPPNLLQALQLLLLHVVAKSQIAEVVQSVLVEYVGVPHMSQQLVTATQ